MKKTLILVVILFILITVIVILGNIITVGEKMTAVIGVPYLEYAFYFIIVGLIAYLIYIAILQPMRRIHNAPEFPVLSVEDKEKGLTDEEYKKRLLAFAERLCDNCYYLPASKREVHQTELRTELTTIKENSDLPSLKDYLTKELRARYHSVDKKIISYGTKVFIITAVSSSNRVDTLATLGLNYRMVSDIVRSSGFRPNGFQLIKLYYYVISSAFFSYFFQDVSESVSDIVDSLTDTADIDLDVSDVEIPDVDTSNMDFTQYVKNLNLPGVPLAPLADGLTNAIMTIAIGYIAKYYLQKGAKELKGVKGKTVNLKAKMKALTQVPLLLVEIPKQIGGTGLSWAMKGFEKAYIKMSKNKSSKKEDFMSDMDRYDSEEIMSLKDTPKKNGIFNFWK